MIYKLMNEMDRLSRGLPGGDSVEDVGKDLNINYGRIGGPAIIGAYAYFTYGSDNLTADERDAIKGIYISDERKGRFKLFPKGYKNIQVSGVLQELVQQQVEKDFDALIEEQGHNAFMPLIKYNLDIKHRRVTNTFRQVLNDCGFDVLGSQFKSQINILQCRNSDAEICLLPNTQLMVVVGDEDNLTAYLSNCQFTHDFAKLLRKAPVFDDSQNGYTNELFSDLDTMKKAWNDYVHELKKRT